MMIIKLGCLWIWACFFLLSPCDVFASAAAQRTMFVLTGTTPEAVARWHKQRHPKSAVFRYRSGSQELEFLDHVALEDINFQKLVIFSDKEPLSTNFLAKLLNKYTNIQTAELNPITGQPPQSLKQELSKRLSPQTVTIHRPKEIVITTTENDQIFVAPDDFLTQKFIIKKDLKTDTETVYELRHNGPPTQVDDEQLADLKLTQNVQELRVEPGGDLETLTEVFGEKKIESYIDTYNPRCVRLCGNLDEDKSLVDTLFNKFGELDFYLQDTTDSYYFMEWEASAKSPPTYNMKNTFILMSPTPHVHNTIVKATLDKAAKRNFPTEQLAKSKKWNTNSLIILGGHPEEKTSYYKNKLNAALSDISTKNVYLHQCGKNQECDRQLAKELSKRHPDISFHIPKGHSIYNPETSEFQMLPYQFRISSRRRKQRNAAKALFSEATKAVRRYQQKVTSYLYDPTPRSKYQTELDTLQSFQNHIIPIEYETYRSGELLRAH